jgi:hypothetical protein
MLYNRIEGYPRNSPLMGVLSGCHVAEYRNICRDGARGTHPPHSTRWLLASTELSESWQRARGWRWWGCCMTNMSSRIALSAKPHYMPHIL